MTWTELSRTKQDEIILRSQKEDVFALAKEFGLLPSSLDRTLRKLKRNGIYEYVLQKDKQKPVQQEKEIKTTASDPFLEKIAAISFPSLGNINNNDIKDVKINGDTSYFVNSQKEWHGIYFTDLHCPYQDDSAVDAMLRVLKVLDHNLIINGGDNLDLFGLSKYAKNSDMLFKNGFVGEVMAHNSIMEKIAAISSAPKISLYGNHMNRYDLWLSQNPFMGTSETNRALSLNTVLSMNHYGWHNFANSIMFTDSQNIMYPNPVLVLDHGERVKSGAGKSAASQFSSYGAVSYIMGHVHRLSVAYKRTLRGQHCLAEGGTLRNLNPEYLRYPDWTNGMLHFVVCKNVVTVTPILIENGTARIGNTKI